MQLVISLRDEKMRLIDRHDPDQVVDIHGPLLCGMQSESAIIDTSRPESILGIHFKPGGTVPFLKCAADELQDSQVPLEDLWGVRARELEERLRDAPMVSSRFRILEQFLLKSAGHFFPILPAFLSPQWWTMRPNVRNVPLSH